MQFGLCVVYVEKTARSNQAGAYADLLLIDGEPLDDITILAGPDSNLRLIMKDGVIYKNTL